MNEAKWNSFDIPAEQYGEFNPWLGLIKYLTVNLYAINVSTTGAISWGDMANPDGTVTKTLGHQNE